LRLHSVPHTRGVLSLLRTFYCVDVPADVLLYYRLGMDMNVKFHIHIHAHVLCIDLVCISGITLIYCNCSRLSEYLMNRKMSAEIQRNKKKSTRFQLFRFERTARVKYSTHADDKVIFQSFVLVRRRFQDFDGG